MVNILPPRHNFASAFGEGLVENLSQLPEQLSDALSAYQQRKRNEEEQDVLARLSVGEEVSPQERKRLSIPVQLKLAELENKKEISENRPVNKQNQPFSDDEFNLALDTLKVPEEQKNAYRLLFKNSTVGGKSAITRSLLDEIDRNKAQNIPSTEKSLTPAESSEFRSEEQKSFEYPKLDTFSGLTRTQKQARENQLRKENTPHYQKAVDGLKKAKHEKFAIDKLEQINDKNVLPTGLGKLALVNLSNGELRFPGISNPHTEQFVKIINDFTTKAKDSFGARVTNFELDRFMQRLPTLLNSSEGRRYIFQYMKSINEIDQLYDRTLKDVYDHYKISNLTSQDAEDIAENITKNKEKEIYDRALNADKEAQHLYEVKQATPKGQIAIIYNNQFGYVPKEQIEEAKKNGAEIL